MIVPALPNTACRTSGSSWWRYWCATVNPSRYLRISESMLASASVVKLWNSSIYTKKSRRLTAHVELAFEQSMTTLLLKVGEQTIGLARYDEQGGFSIELGEG